MLHQITKICFAMQEILSVFILPQSVEYARDMILSLLSGNGYYQLSDKQISDLVTYFEMIINFYHELPIEIDYSVISDSNDIINGKPEIIMIILSYKPDKARV